VWYLETGALKGDKVARLSFGPTVGNGALRSRPQPHLASLRPAFEGSRRAPGAGTRFSPQLWGVGGYYSVTTGRLWGEGNEGSSTLEELKNYPNKRHPLSIQNMGRVALTDVRKTCQTVGGVF